MLLDQNEDLKIEEFVQEFLNALQHVLHDWHAPLSKLKPWSFIWNSVPFYCASHVGQVCKQFRAENGNFVGSSAVRPEYDWVGDEKRV